MRELNSQWLKSFTVLCEEGHFTRAAERLNMTQPGMSQHITKLEQQLGTALIERGSSGFALTDAGEKTLAMARARWREETEFFERLEGEDADSGKVDVACSGSFAMLLYPRLIAWMADSPGIRAGVTAAPQDSIVSGVLSGIYDAGVVGDVPRHPRFVSDYLGAEPLDLILPHEWEGRLPRFEDLESLGFIQHPDGSSYADAVLAANFPKQYRGADRLNVRSFINQLGQIPEPIAQGLGYSILPRSGVLAFPRRERLSIAPFPQPSFLQLHILRVKRKIGTPRRDKLAALIREVAEKVIS